MYRSLSKRSQFINYLELKSENLKADPIHGRDIATGRCIDYLWPAGGARSCQVCLPCSVKRSLYCHRNKVLAVHAVPIHSVKSRNQQINTGA